MAVPKVRTTGDFIADWTGQVREHLAKLGVRVRPSLPDDRVRYAFIGLLRRRGGRVPRDLFVADEFNASPKYDPALRVIQQKLETGGDLTPHLSEEVERLVNDGLFEDWGIMHFHLETKMKGRFVKRTGPVLYAFVAERAAYFLDVRAHGEWANIEFLEIMHANFPDALARWRVPGAVPQAPGFRPTAVTFEQTRTSGIMALITLRDGAVYVSPGGGYSTARVPTRSVDIDDRNCERIRQLEVVAELYIDQLRASALEKGIDIGPEPVPIGYHFDFDYGRESLTCRRAEFGWTLPPNFDPYGVPL